MKKNSVGLFELKTAVLEYFLEKTPLNPLGVKGLWVPYMEFRDFGHTTTIPISNWIFWNSFCGWEIQRAFQQAITRKIWTFNLRFMVIQESLFICGQGGQHKKHLQIFFKKIKENCAMLDRSIPTRKALVHSIPISEVKDMTSDVLQALKASLFEKIILNLVWRLNFNNFQENSYTLNFFLQHFHYWNWHILNPFEIW